MLEKENKSGGKCILVISGLIISGLIIVFALQSKHASQTSSIPSPPPIQQILEQQTITNAMLTPAQTPLEPIQRWVLQPPQIRDGSEAQNLIQYKDGNVTDIDAAVADGEKYKNKESWVVSRDADGAIVGIDIERNATVENAPC